MLFIKRGVRMNEEKDFFKTCFNTVAGLEVKNESQAIAKEVVLSEIEQLQQENKQLKIEISAREEVCNRLESNWNKLREIIRKKQDYYRHFKDNRYRKFLSELLDIMQELERSDSDE